MGQAPNGDKGTCGSCCRVADGGYGWRCRRRDQEEDLRRKPHGGGLREQEKSHVCLQARVGGREGQAVFFFVETTAAFCRIYGRLCCKEVATSGFSEHLPS